MIENYEERENKKINVVIVHDLGYCSNIPRRKRNIDQYNPKLLDLIYSLEDYKNEYKRGNSNNKNDKVIEEIEILNGIIKHPRLEMKAKRRQFSDRFYRVSRKLLEPPRHKKALRWIFRKIDNFANMFRCRRKFTLSKYFFKANINERLCKKLDEKLMVSKYNSL